MLQVFSLSETKKEVSNMVYQKWISTELLNSPECFKDFIRAMEFKK